MKNQKRKKIQHKLNEFKETKSRVLTEEKIIKNRLGFIFESSLKNNSINVDELSTSLINEVAYLQEQGYRNSLISESVGGFFNILKSIAGDGAFGSFVDTLQEKIAAKICKMLKINPKSTFGRIITVTIGNIDYNDLPHLFDCRFIASKITESLPEALISQKLTGNYEDKGGLLGNIAIMMRNYLTSTFVNDSKMMNKIEDMIATAICGFLTNMSKAATQKYSSYVGAMRNNNTASI